MKIAGIKLLLILTVLAAGAGFAPGCTPPLETDADSYVAVIPRTLRSGSAETVSLTLLRGDALASSRVQVSLLKQGSEVASASQTINGKGTVTLNIPVVDEGDYEVRVRGAGFDDKVSVKVDKSLLVFVETDKPIYKPGQTAHIRVLTLDPELKPVTETVTIDILDAKGIKIFRSEARTDDFGMATLDLPISEEPNLGVWKITGTAQKTKTQLDFRVEQYVLPKYEINIELPKEWFLVSEAIKGKISADYSFGKPVKGEVEIKATRYTGKWEQYALVTKDIDGSVEFELPPVQYVAGTPASGGMGNVTLDFTVREKATGYEEKTSRLLTVAQAPFNIQIIPEGSTFMPGLPFSFLVVTETPDRQPAEGRVQLNMTYVTGDFKQENSIEQQITTTKGKAIVTITPPKNSVAVMIQAYEMTPRSSTPPAQANRTVQASYSPSGNFIHVEQVEDRIPKVGEEISFKITSTREAANFYYEVISRGKVVFSDFTRDTTIALTATPLMSPAARLLVYQVLPNSEVASDYVPFKVEGQYPQAVTASFSQGEAEPGEDITVNIQTQGAAQVGLAVVDKSVFILAENRLNLQQVFNELERLYMQPQAELHSVSIYEGINTRGAKETFRDAGVVVLTNKSVPEGKEYKPAVPPFMRIQEAMGGKVAVPAPTPAPSVILGPPQDAGALAEVQRVRQYFPETWLWETLKTDASGKASLNTTVPDSITTWMMRAVAISKEKGLGIAESELRAFQPFFATIDLPYSAIRGEEFPVRVAVYNYLETPQQVLVQMKTESWFELLGGTQQTIEIKPNDIGSASFKIRPVKLGTNEIKVTVQSREAADALVRTLIVAPEGIAREVVENFTIGESKPQSVAATVPLLIVPDSARAYLAVTASYLTQTMQGLEGLLQMPFGCGEQNMILFAPNVFVTKYLKESGQLKPEIMAKAEKLMLTGYQRELIYRRSDGSFSAFGQSDKDGSLWLTAFVLKSFAQARDLIYIDTGILDSAMSWILNNQAKDGSFDVVGFVHHQEMMGGATGKTALTAYVAVALMEAGEATGSSAAVRYLEQNLATINEPYNLAITAYALALAKSPKSAEARQKLMGMANEDENGLHWGGGGEIRPLQNQQKAAPIRPGIVPPQPRTSDIETTAYATLALVQGGDPLNAGRAARWLVSQRNAYGGYGSTQDTVVSLQALTEQAAGSRGDVDLVVKVKAGTVEKELTIKPNNFDVLQVIDIPVNENIEITAKGKGEAIAQVVRRFNIPTSDAPEEILKLKVDYDTTEVAVNDTVNVSVNVRFDPPEYIESGMVVLDVSVPTGFAPVTETIATVLGTEPRIKRYDVAGRKVIFYVDNLLRGDEVSFSFKVQALYPVKAKAVSSQAYSYYQPELRGESLGQDISVN